MSEILDPRFHGDDKGGDDTEERMLLLNPDHHELFLTLTPMHEGGNPGII